MQNIRKTLLLFAAIAALLVMAVYFFMRTNTGNALEIRPNPASLSAPEDVDSNLSTGNKSGNSKNLPGAALNPFNLIRQGGTVVQSLDSAIVQFGKDDPKVYAFFKAAYYMCSGNHDPAGALALKDNTRLWAVDRLSKVCEGFDPAKYRYEMPPIADVASVMRKQGLDAAVSDSRRLLETSLEHQELFESGALLIETGKIPLSRILPNYNQDYSTFELVESWNQAVTMLACQESGGCDSYSLHTLRYCTIHGCSQNSSLDAAYRRNMSPRQYEAAMAFYRWLAAQRKRP